MKKVFLGVYNPSIILTYIGVFCGLFGLGAIASFSNVASLDIIPIIMMMLSISGICDCFDGAIARKCKRTEVEKKFGVQLDSLADMVSFVILPAITVLFLNNNSWHSFIIACFYVFAGIMRLGWFNVTTEESGGYYTGLPVTCSALIFPILSVIIQIFDLYSIRSLLFEIVCGVVGILFILNFKHKKTGLVFAIVWAILALFTIILSLIF